MKIEPAPAPVDVPVAAAQAGADTVLAAPRAFVGLRHGRRG